ncbi:UNVERIFIED_ORG: peptide/nickel transport system substrate-binding protein [Nocardia globerula]|uniref:Peptide/nickel transport system substrate-binding protein n=1 Tax=Nocardia globerula TaxID=1818 RepID=A0A652YSW5_NOCGL|nr:ABC transporter substrate-binding protein [Rhodococcus globerulus]PVX67101.1 peptide/nickel transport system substrate-binding protein [Rhodococcus globerulus]
MYRKRVLGALSCATLLLVGACGGGSADTTATSSGVVDRDATMTMGWILPPPMMDPHATPSIIGAYPYLSLVYDRLVRVEKDPAGSKFVPMLADSWEFSEDGRVLTFHLRTDAKFHDGTPVDAAAVQWSLNRAMTKPTSTVSGALGAIDRVEAPDPNTVAVYLKRPASDVIYHLSTLAGAIVNPAAGDRDLSREVDGSGPYQLAELKVGDRASFTRFDGYWDPQAQNMAKVAIVGMVDDQARLNALRSGQIDAALTKVTQFADVEQLTKSSNFGVADTDHSAWYAMYLNADNPALADVRVRRAMNLAIDREGINTSLLSGQCEPTSQPLQKGVIGHDPQSEGRYGYDPDQAKRLLQEAGHADGLQLKVLTLAGVRTSDGLAVAIKEQLSKVGIDLQLQPRELGQAVIEWKEGKADGLQYTHPGATDPAVTMQEAYLSTLYPGARSADVEKVLQTPLDSTLSPEAREAALKAASSSASENALELFVCSIPTQYTFDKKVVGLEEMSPPVAGGPFDLRNVRTTG